jgi:hypothetical protein
MLKRKWVFSPAPDDSVDDQWDLSWTDLSIQVAGKGHYIVNEFNEVGGWVDAHGTFKTLKQAKAYAEALARKRSSRNGSVQ